ncbi:MAG: hypothetical protein Fur0024_4900 [Patescibacteria group bacterium]
MIENYISLLSNVDLILFFVFSVFFFIIFIFWKNKTRKEKDTDFFKIFFINTGSFLFFYLLFVSFLKILEKFGAISESTFLKKSNVVFLAILWFLIGKIFIKFFVQFILKPRVKKTESRLDDSFLPVLEKIFIFFLSTILIIFILNNFGLNTNSLIASFGIGGLAVAIASQQSLAHIFGAISLFADDVFNVGDYIVIYIIPKPIEGIVKKVGLRSTQIIGKTGEILIVPNAEIQSRAVANYGRRSERRVEWVFNFPITTSKEKIKLARKIIENSIRTAGSSIKKDAISVSLKEITGSILKLYTVFYIITPSYENSVRIRGNINMMILDGFEREGIYFASEKKTENDKIIVLDDGVD